MARVVQRSTNLLYLVVVFVFLFLVSAALAAMFYTHNEESQKAVAKAEYDKGKAVESEREYAKDFAHVASLVTGDPNNGPRATADLIERAVPSHMALLPVVKDCQQSADDEKKTSAALKTQLDAASAAAAAKEKDTADLLKQDAQAKDELGKKLKEAQDQLQAAHEKYLADAEDIKKQNEDKRSEQDLTIQKQNQTIQADLLKIGKQDQRIADLQQRNDELNGKRSASTENTVARIKGHVAQVMADQGTCYIDLGSRDRVSPGMTFSVYPTTGIPVETGEGKAAITVVSVNDRTAQCRIASGAKDDAIMAGDPIGNVAYDALRTYTFAVEGQFDLTGHGTPTAEGADEVKSMIKHSGGKVSDDVGLNTDFIVMGAEPPKPTKPKESDPATAQKNYEDLIKPYNHYQEVLRQAQAMKIPMLNTNRFLALVGYVPGKEIARQ